MASTYFTLPSFARAKQNREQLEKSNPQNPVLKDEDEKFLERHISQDQPANSPASKPVAIDEQGGERVASPEEVHQATPNPDQVAIPEEQPEEPAPALPPRPSNKKKEIELPSQEEAEAATRSFKFNPTQDSSTAKPDSRTWASYLPSLPATTKKSTDPSPPEDPSSNSKEKDSQRTWTEYASTYIPSALKPKDKDSAPSPIYNPDGTINEPATAQQQEREISVLLDNLNMSTFNDRVFALSSETQKIYDRFAQCLKDTMNGVPTAYDDMEKLMKEAGPTLEAKFKAMPPFVQTLVKSLPAKLSTMVPPGVVAPELLGGKGADAKKREEAAGEKAGKKKKRTVPGLKKLISQEGAVAGILRNVVNFIKVRFPFLASTTNVVMSLAVFILMFVFWYCHKRGKETRLAKEAEELEKAAQEEDDDSLTAEASSEDEGEEESNDKVDVLNQPHPSQVPLPEENGAKEEQGP